MAYNETFDAHVICDSGELETMQRRDDITSLLITDIDDITSICGPFPRNLMTLRISACKKLVEVSGLHEGIANITLEYLPELTTVQQIPSTVSYLAIYNTGLMNLTQDLSTLPLKECYLHSNRLNHISSLPSTLTHFNCFNNPLSETPILPVSIDKMEYVELNRINCN